MVLSGPHHLEQTQIPGFFPTALLWAELTLPHSNKTFSWIPQPPRITLRFSFILAAKCVIEVVALQFVWGLGVGSCNFQEEREHEFLPFSFFLLARMRHDG